MDRDRARKEFSEFKALDPDHATILKINDRLLEVFVVDCIQNHRLKEKSAREHAARVDHFGKNYLLEFEGVPLSEAEGSDIEDYMGNWYPRYVPDADPKDIKRILKSLETFYRYLYEIREIDREILSGIVETCQDRHRLLR